MLRRLILMRHAKSPPGPTDHARPISDQGRADVERIARRIAQIGFSPDAMVASDATRCVQTWEAMAPHLGGTPTTRWEPAFYLGSPDALADELYALDDDVQTVVLLGHNPGWSRAASYLTGRPIALESGAAALLSREMSSWTEAFAQGRWTLEQLLAPSQMNDG